MRLESGRTYWSLQHRNRAEDYLARHMAAARAQVQVGFDTATDAEQRMRCATLLGGDRANPYRLELVPYLVDSLRDNHVSGDAARATATLMEFGGHAVPALLAVADGSSSQQARLAGAILVRLGGDPPSIGATFDTFDLRGVVRSDRLRVR